MKGQTTLGPELQTVFLVEVSVLDSTYQQAHSESLRRMGFAPEADYLKPWAEKIGQFIFNFGGLELTTHKYLLLLEADQQAFEESIKRLLQPRIDRVIELLSEATHLPDDARQLAIRDWGEIKQMCLWRNHIAHNPVLTYWALDQDPSRDPPEGITMPDLRVFHRGEGVHVDMKTLAQLVEVSANLSRRLVETANSLFLQDGNQQLAGLLSQFSTSSSFTTAAESPLKSP